jgi:hypothetical protein
VVLLIVFGLFGFAFGVCAGVVDEPVGEGVCGVDGVPAWAAGFGVADFAGVAHGGLEAGVVGVGEPFESRKLPL